MTADESLQLHYPTIFADFPTLAAAQSTRYGGVSQPPYDSLNLGLHTEDDREAVLENRKRFFAACGFRPDQTAGSHQVHGAEVLKVDAAGYFTGYDALITDQTGILLTVTVADCTPILLYDPVRRAMAAVHAGWKGTVSRIVVRALDAMREHYGTEPADCRAYIGTCIDHCDFEVDADVADHFTDTHKHWDEAKGKFLVNLKQTNRDHLQQAGLPGQQIECSPYSTFSRHRDFFSHRFEKGKTGRMLAAIGLRS
ncbi:peptidoglycan editing factor PgeF [Flavilitoribacter nigricans]|uniref:Purine nucleoside phosphorylase n=1 Tax=Flavilitoribacter nigricans (strain ATCC 23147 / DSM 23189 / NBRC 102662 / NCIMB 1420 / SS-2) TaxID=1122177 RepID=A0A2D0N907_FLAN2|nr:peptidoglycan editing factor PgeF [Flavilitoribacter nigricans]PHN04965.1 polyphenol oxidoreductase [Flavilitoribacter nigricans DSM 23189 = NBRC 102662]